MNERDAIEAAAAQAAKPTATDVAQAAGLVITLVSAGTAVRILDVVADLCVARGINPNGAQTPINLGEGELESIISAESVQYARMLHATQQAVARLVAQGLIVGTQVEGAHSYGAGIPVEYREGSSSSNRTGNIMVSVSSLLVPSAFQITPGTSSEAGEVPLLTSEKWLSGLDLLMTGRLPRLLDEALDAYRRARYLSAATLLGSISEGAWTRAGEMLRGRVPKLDDALDRDPVGTAEVQKRMWELFKANKIRHADGLYNFAGYIRTVRNYGIHPNAADDDSAEQALSESGCFSLIQCTHGHLLTLLDVTESMATKPPSRI